MIAGENYETAVREVDGTTVVSHYLPEDVEAGAKIADYGAEALASFNELFGPYPYAELDLVELPLVTPSGPALPRLTGFDASRDDDLETLAEFGFAERLVEFVVAQEVANQWWSQLVGTNHDDHAFLDEAVSDAAGIVSVGRRSETAEADSGLRKSCPDRDVETAQTSSARGPTGAASSAPPAARTGHPLCKPLERILDLATRSLYAYTFFVTGDEAVDRPTDAFSDSGSSFGIVYGKGTLGFQALRGEIGNEAFVAALRDHAARYRFAVAQPADPRNAFARAARRLLDALVRVGRDAGQRPGRNRPPGGRHAVAVAGRSGSGIEGRGRARRASPSSRPSVAAWGA